MNVLHLSTNDQAGGAARAAYRLHTGLQAIGVHSTMLCAGRTSNDPTVQAIGKPNGRTGRLQRWLRQKQIDRTFAPYKAMRPVGLEPFSDDRSRYGAELVRQLPQADVINLHWVARFIDYGAFFPAVASRTPVVWRLSDMNPFTGGCHYDEECGRFVASCGACPQLGSREPNDLSQQVWRRKRAALDTVPPGRLQIVALNEWIAGQARRSALLQGVPVHVIPNGLDTEAFAPRDQAYARKVLGLPQDGLVVLFVAASTQNRRKGFGLLAQALAGLVDLPGLHLVSVGKGDVAAAGVIPHLNLGSLDQDRMLSLVYSAADVFAIPSLQDNMPSTVLEALACATPVVGFDAGGVAEMVRPGETGLLAKVGDVGELREALRRLLTDAALRRGIGVRCREVVLSEYTQELQARRYLALYERILDARAAQQASPAALGDDRGAVSAKMNKMSGK